MEELVIRVGDILQVDDKAYRIIYILSTNIVLCRMNIEKLDIAEYDLQAIRTGVLNGDINVITDNDNQVVDISKLSEKEAEAYQVKSSIIKEIVKNYGPAYLDLMGKKHKEPISKILQKYDLKKKAVWKICRVYLQSGMKESSLLRKKPSGSGNPLTGKKRGDRKSVV